MNQMARRHKLQSVIHFARSYFAAIPRILYRTSLSPLIDPRGTQRFLDQVLNAIDLESDDPVLGSASIEDMIPGGGDVRIVGPYYSCGDGGTHILLEIASLAYLIKHLDPRLVFEIGTFKGRTTRLIAANSSKGCKIITLDLPQGNVAHQVGEDFHKTSEASRIQQVYGNSRIFDFSPWLGKCDFVWIDGCHEFEFVKSDTENSLKLTRPGGWIGWHDYHHSSWWSGVTGCVRALRKEYPHLVHLRGTTIVLLRSL
jgi:SAM-dependent methyltransferase